MNSKLKKQKIFFAVFLCLILVGEYLIFTSNISLAQEDATTEDMVDEEAVTTESITKIPLEVPLLNYTEAKNLTEYIKTVYKSLIYILVPLAIVVIIYAGIRWILAGGNQSKIKEARGYITGALTGLLIGLLSYVILSFVGITELRMPEIEDITAIDGIEIDIADIGTTSIGVSGGGFTSGSPAGTPTDSSTSSYSSGGVVPGNFKVDPGEIISPDDCLKTDELKNMLPAVGDNGGKLVLGRSGFRLRPIPLQKLYQASDAAVTRGCKIRLNSAARSVSDQAALRSSKGAVGTTMVASASCSAPHTTGGAVDVGIQCSNKTCGRTAASGPVGTCPSAELKQIIFQVMTSVGWANYRNEWWHFEYGTPRWQRCAGGRC